MDSTTKMQTLTSLLPDDLRTRVVSQLRPDMTYDLMREYVMAQVSLEQAQSTKPPPDPLDFTAELHDYDDEHNAEDCDWAAAAAGRWRPKGKGKGKGSGKAKGSMAAAATCWACGRPGHQRAECPLLQPSGPPREKGKGKKGKGKGVFGLEYYTD